MTAPRRITVADLDRGTPERLAEVDGWVISSFRTAFGARAGTDSMLFRATFRPGARHERHRHTRAAEISFCLSGNPIAGTGTDVRRVGPDTARWIARDVSHFLSADGAARTETEIVGMYVRAGSVAESGYVHDGEIGTVLPDTSGDPAPYPCVTVPDSPPLEPSLLGWSRATVRMPLGAHSGCEAAVLTIDAEPVAEGPAMAFDGTDAVLYVREGELELEHEFGRTGLARGWAAHLPHGAAHRLRCGPAWARLLVFLPHAADLGSAMPRGA